MVIELKNVMHFKHIQKRESIFMLGLILVCLKHFSANGCVEGIVHRLKTYKDPDVVHEIKVNQTLFAFAVVSRKSKIPYFDWIVVKHLHNVATEFDYGIYQYYVMENRNDF